MRYVDQSDGVNACKATISPIATPRSCLDSTNDFRDEIDFFVVIYNICVVGKRVEYQS